jgi:hypothetical protein
LLNERTQRTTILIVFPRSPASPPDPPARVDLALRRRAAQRDLRQICSKACARTVRFKWSNVFAQHSVLVRHPKDEDADLKVRRAMFLAESNQPPDSPEAVEEYCVEFEQRADDLLVRLERTR